MRWAEHVVQMGETYKNWDEENRWEEKLGRIDYIKYYVWVCSV